MSATRRAICELDPAAIPIARSILFFIAIMTTVECPATLPRSGARITPTKNCVIPHALAALSYTPIYISFIAATNTITAAGTPIEREQLQHCSLKSEAS
jgi:hypothetical protein